VRHTVKEKGPAGGGKRSPRREGYRFVMKKRTNFYSKESQQWDSKIRELEKKGTSLTEKVGTWVEPGVALKKGKNLLTGPERQGGRGNPRSKDTVRSGIFQEKRWSVEEFNPP